MLKNLPFFEKPRERCLAHGPGSLSLRECLALILAPGGAGPQGGGCLGLSSTILEKPGSGLNPKDQERAFFLAMEGMGPAFLSGINGLGPAGVAKLLAAFELGRRYSVFRCSGERLPNGSFHLPKTAENALKKVDSEHRNAPKEWLGFVAIFANRTLSELCIVEKGVRTHVNIEPAELFSHILALRPAGFFLFHNHPSGDITPSPQDLDLTLRVREIASALNVLLLGHWIVSPRANRWIPPTLGANESDLL